MDTTILWLMPAATTFSQVLIFSVVPEIIEGKGKVSRRIDDTEESVEEQRSSANVLVVKLPPTTVCMKEPDPGTRPLKFRRQTPSVVILAKFSLFGGQSGATNMYSVTYDNGHVAVKELSFWRLT